jgi:hypothetical protein
MSDNVAQSLTIYGASDDLVEVDGIERGEIDCWDRRVDFEIGTVDGGGYRVGMWHDGRLGWQVTLGLLATDDDVPLPWPARVELSETGYSLAVIINCPAGTRVTATRNGESIPIK